MKVAHINTYCSGGAAIACKRIVKALNKSGTDAEMLVLYKTIHDENIFDFRYELTFAEKIKLKFANKYNVVLNQYKYANKEELFSPYYSVWDINRHSLVQSADVINLHWVSGFVDFNSFLKNKKKKIVFTLHDFYPFSGGFHYPNLYFNTSFFKEEINRNLHMLEKLYNQSDIHFVGPSGYIINQFEKNLPLKNATSSVIRNPVDRNLYFYSKENSYRQKAGFDVNDKVLLYINDKLKYNRKGYLRFKEIIPELLRHGYKIIMAGDRDTELQDASVFQTGFVNSDSELNKIYNSSDLLLYTSFNDNLPNTISESLCSGIPVIAFNNGGIGEMIQDGVNGRLIEGNNLRAFANGVDEILTGKTNNHEISKVAHEVYSEIKAAEKYNEIYNLNV